MLQNLVTLVVGGAVTLGIGGGAGFYNDLTAAQQKEILDAKTKAVEVLTTEEKELVKTLEDKSMRDLTVEEKTEVRAIKDKLHDEMIENITDEALKAQMEERHEERVAKRGTGQGNGMHQGNNN